MGIRWFLLLPLKKRVIGAVLFVAVASYFASFFLKNDVVVAPEEVLNMPAVEVLSVGALSESGAPLSLPGEVKSRSEANIKTEASGRVIHVYKKIGDAVLAGEVIAEIENAREVAALEQAKAVLAQAQASQNISEISLGSSELLLGEARNSAVNTLRSTYDGVEDAIRNKIDPMFSNPDTPNPSFNVQSSNNQLVTDLNFTRLKMQALLSAEKKRRDSLAVGNDLLAEIKMTENELAEVKKFIDLVNATLNLGLATTGIPQATIDAHKVVASAARTSWGSLVANISTTKDNLTAKTAQYETARKQGGSGLSGTTTSDAAVAQAQSGVQLARVALEKTIVRSPIFGTVNSLPITEGDFVSALQPAATVSNNAALEIVAYITSLDSREVVVGNAVQIQGTAKGVVTRVAPALDPLTKKIEVRIGVSEGIESLLNGQSVSLMIARSKDVGGGAKDPLAALSIPIASLKITPDGPVVFTVEGGVLIEHAVKLGALLGDRVVVTEGLTRSMEIVKDARGLKNGQVVLIK